MADSKEKITLSASDLPKGLEAIKDEDAFIKIIRVVASREYEDIKVEAKNYGELIKKSEQRYREVAYRDANLGAFLKDFFKTQVRKEMGNIECLPKEN